MYRAKPEDAEALSALAFRSKSVWRYPAEYLEAARPLLRLTPEYISRNEVWVAEDGAGFFALEGALLDHFWVAPEQMARGIGRAMYAFMRERAAQLGWPAVHWYADPGSEGFYLKMGAERVGEKPSRVAGGPVFPVMQACAADALIFDLDGTLWRASEASALGWNEALRAHGSDRVLSADDIASVSGLPFRDCIARLCPNVVDPEAFFATLSQCEHESVRRHGGRLYEGVEEGLAALVQRYRLFIVSNCQEWYLQVFLDAFGRWFEGWECHGRTSRPKHENIRSVIARYEVKRPIYIGDTDGDRAAAAGAGVGFIHAAYGFGQVSGSRRIGRFSDLLTL